MALSDQAVMDLFANLVKQLKTGGIKLPNRSGGANGAEIIAKIDAAIGTDWKSGTGAEILAVIEAAADVDLTGNLSVAGTTVISTKTPATAGATGTAGEIAWDGSFIYICSATDTWLRVAIATW